MKANQALHPFPLTSSERKVLGFLAFLTLLGALAWGFEALTGRAAFGLPAEVPSPGVLAGSARPPVPGGRAFPSGPLDLNHAGAGELRWVPGVGPRTAARIVQYRETHGPFGDLKDLMRVPGIGGKKYAKMAPHLTLRP